MNPTTSHSSPYKLILIVISIVVSLHVLTAMALVMIKPQSIPVKPLKVDEVTPIEIELVTPPVNIEQIVTKEVEIEPIKDAKVQPKAKPFAVAKPQAAEKTKPTNKPTLVVKKQTVNEDRKAVKSKDKVVEDKLRMMQQPIKKQSIPVANTSTQEELTAQGLRDQRQRVLAAQAEAETASQAESLHKQQALAQAQEEAQDKANAAKEAQKRAAQQAAKRASEQAALQQAVKEAAAQAASNEPADYGNIGKSSWSREPIFTSIQNKNYGFRGSEASIRVSMTVDSSGNISNIKISQSSGKDTFDNDFVTVLSRAKLNPATRGNAPTKSIANFSFHMTL